MAKKNNNRNKYRTRRHENETQESYDYRRFASASASKSGTTSNTSISGFSETRLKSMLQDPARNAVQVANLSRSMKQVNGMYKRVIKYLSSLLTYDHTIYPVLDNPVSYAENPQDLQMAFAQTSIFVDRLNPKFHLPLFGEKMLTTGTTFQYKLEDSKSIAYMEIPVTYCRISYIEDGVYRYQIDITKLTETTIPLYPKEIQTAYQSYKNGNTDKLEDSKWYQVSDKGVAFTLDSDVLYQSGYALPPMANALLDAIKVENAKENMEDIAKLDNTKIVHSKIETDDKGRPLMELPVVQEYHNALKRTLPEGSVAITNPFETKGIALNGTGNDGKFALLEKSIDNLYDSTGVSKLLFAGDGASSQALERSIQVDAQWLYSFMLPMFANYYNYELKKVNKKGMQWKIKFMSISHFDRAEAIKTAKDQLSYGGSRLEYLAYTGMTPIEVANMLIFEQRVLDIDDFMIAKQNSNTLSSDDVGAPKSDNPTDTTIRINDSK